MNVLMHTPTQETTLLHDTLSSFVPKITILIESSQYILKTATTQDELIESFKLRHEVFSQEFQGNHFSGVDVDEFDIAFDHLIIIHKISKKVVGVYRLGCRNTPLESYTATEFDIDDLFDFQGPYLELGRACIQKEFRNGSSVLQLLWKGILEYIKLSNANILFGCSSIKINTSKDAALVFKYLNEKNYVMAKNTTHPRENFTLKEFSATYKSLPDYLDPSEFEKAENLTPPLLKSYLRYGAKIACEPAYDQDFDCIDLLTVMKREDIFTSLSRRLKILQ